MVLTETATTFCFLSYSQEMGINMGRSVFYKVLNKFEDPTKVLSEGFGTNKNLDLLVVVLPGKTHFYREFLNVFTSVII